MGAEPNTKLAEKIYSFYNYLDSKQYNDMFALVDDNITYHRPGRDTLEGIDKFRAIYPETQVAPEGEHTVQDIIVDNNTVAVRGEFADSSQDLEFGFAEICKFNEEGKIKERWTFTSRDEL